MTGAVGSPDARSRYLVSSLMEEAIASSRIEGASTTRRVAKEMLRTGRPPKSIGERMIVNNYRAVSKLNELRDEPVTPGLLVRIQAMLTEGTLDHPRTLGQSGRATTSSCTTSSGKYSTFRPKHRSSPRSSSGSADTQTTTRARLFTRSSKGPSCISGACLSASLRRRQRKDSHVFYLFMLKKNYGLCEDLAVRA